MTEILERCASAHGLPLALLRAMMQVESGRDAAAWNPKLHWRYLWHVKRRRPFRELTSADSLNDLRLAFFAAALVPRRCVRSTRPFYDSDIELCATMCRHGDMAALCDPLHRSLAHVPE